MLIKAFYKLTVFIGPLIIIWYMLFVYFDGEAYVEAWSDDYITHEKVASSSPHHVEVKIEDPPPAILPKPEPKEDEHSKSIHTGNEPDGIHFVPPPIADVPPLPAQEPLPPPAFPAAEENDYIVDTNTHREIFSASTSDRKYFPINFGPEHPAINPNVIPHPQEENTYIIIAQRDKEGDILFEEIACNAIFQLDGSLACKTSPVTLPIAPTHTQNCKDEMAYMSLGSGPHDMRVFWGPDAPYVVYGSQSAHTCFGLFVQDFRTLVPNEYGLEAFSANLFTAGTELQRPLPWHPVEKNWFMFWDLDKTPYIHHDISPSRVFAQLLPDGGVGPDLAPHAALNDNACMNKYLPPLSSEKGESIHQATNALSITLCASTDTTCTPTPSNTFILTIIQHKQYKHWHATYEPYVMLFQSSAPFGIHAISAKPLWIHGRSAWTEKSRGKKWKGEVPEGQTEMFYVTSVGWKKGGWHGHLDDVVVIGFGIEDERSAGVDVVVGDLLQDLGVCSDGMA